MAQTSPAVVGSPVTDSWSTSTTSRTITLPAGITAEHSLYLFVSSSANGQPSSISNGTWAQVPSALLNSGSPPISGGVWSRRAAPADSSTTVTVTWASNVFGSLVLLVVKDVGGDTIVVHAPTVYTSTGTASTTKTNVSGTVTTTDANCLVLEYWFGANASGSFTALVSMTPPATAEGAAFSTTSSSQGLPFTAVSAQAQAAAGASTAQTLSFTTSSAAPAYSVAAITLALPPIQVPAAPTLTAPANAVFNDLSGTPTFTWTANPTTGDGPQNAVEFRQKISGAGTYNYWNPGSSTFQSTPIYFTQTTGTITFPSGAWVNGNIYNWSVSTQETYETLQSAFASDFTVTAQAPPSAVVTAPTGTIQTTSPTVTATATVASGASVTAYRIVVYTAAQVAAGGFTPGTTVGVYDSGVVTWSSTSISQPVSGLANNVTYYSYIQITETGGETGAWASQAFTVSFDAPAAPTVVVTPGTDGTTGAPIITVAVTAHDNLLSAVDASFEGSVGTWTAGANTTVASTTAQALDGSNSMSLTATAAGAVTASTSTTAYPVVPNVSHIPLAALIAGATGRAFTIAVSWYNSAGALISTVTSAAATDSTGRWTYVIGAPIVAPATASKAQVTVNGTGLGASEVHDTDCAGIFPADTLGPLLQILQDGPSALFLLSDPQPSTVASNAVQPAAGATVNGGVTFGQPGPIASDPSQTAALFDGSTGYLAPTAQILPTGPFTVEMMVKAAPGNGTSRIIGSCGGGTTGLDIILQAGGPSLNYGTGAANAGVSGGTGVTDGNWHIVGFTCDGTNLASYTDGVQSHTGSGAGLSPGARIPYIGAFNFGPGAGDFFAGQIAYVAIYPVALSSTRMAAHAAAMRNTAGNILQRWTRGGLVGLTTVDVWARTGATSTVADAQRPATTGIRVAAALTPNGSQTVSWIDWAAASGAVYQYEAVVNGGTGIATPSTWTA